jgi:two-component system sensor histidine kinase EvgS
MRCSDTGEHVTGLRASFAAASFDNERDNAAASLLSVLLWLTIAGAASFEVFQLHARIDRARVYWVGSVLVVAVVAMVLLRLGHLRTSAWLTTASLFAIACASIWLAGGVHAPGAATLVLLILMSAMALEWPPTVVWTLLSAVAIFGFVLAEQQGWLPPAAPRRPPLELGFIYMLHIGVAAWLVSYSAGAFRGVLGTLGRRSVELADSEERYAQLVEQSPDVMVAIDGDGTLLEASPAIEALYGVTPEAVVGRRFADLAVIPGDLLEENVHAFRALLEGGQPDLTRRRILHADGSTRWVEANSRLVRREDGTARLYLVIRDVTARVEDEERRASLERELIEARRLEALGRMAGALAHDFNNLLVVILSNAELLAEGSKANEKELAGEIQVAGAAAAELTAQLLDFAGQQAGEDESVDVNSSLARVEPLLRRLLLPDVHLEIRSQTALPEASGDPAQIERVLVNLVMNASQSMPDGGALTIEATAAQVTQAECERHRGATAGPHVRIAVTDTGSGMDDKTIQRVFEPFYSRREGGTGLGLATVHAVVSQHGGHVRIRSRLGEGTRVEVLLPHSTRAASRAAQADDVAAPVSSSERPVVLLVDDEAAVLSSVGRLLESSGYRVLRASSPDAAWDVSCREAGRIDLLLTDVLMPGTSGPKLAARLCAARPDTKVLLMSGYTEDHLEHGDLPPAAVHFIAKPFSGRALDAKIRLILGEARPKDAVARRGLPRADPERNRGAYRGPSA